MGHLFVSQSFTFHTGQLAFDHTDKWSYQCLTKCACLVQDKLTIRYMYVVSSFVQGQLVWYAVSSFVWGKLTIQVCLFLNLFFFFTKNNCCMWSKHRQAPLSNQVGTMRGFLLWFGRLKLSPFMKSVVIVFKIQAQPFETRSISLTLNFRLDKLRW